jgi:hypothetical protein
MSQQINLLNPALVRPRDWLTLRNMFLIYVVLIALLVGLNVKTEGELTQLTAERDAALVSLNTVKKTLDEIKNVEPQTNRSKEQELELQDLIETRETQSSLLTSLKHINSEGHQHVMDYMLGFANRSLTGVWLTGFKINSFEQQVSIAGQSLSPELVPQYMERLGDDPVFHGKLFSGLVMKEQSIEISEPKPAGVKTPEVVQNSKDQTMPATPEPAPLNVISFEFKGQSVHESDTGTENRKVDIPVANTKQGGK